MLDFADFVVLNKFEKRGAEDALRDVRKQWRRNHPERCELADDAKCRCSRPSPAGSTIRASTACSRRSAQRLDAKQRGRWHANWKLAGHRSDDYRRAIR